MTVRVISTLSILEKVLPKSNCPKCSKEMTLKGNDEKSYYYHECSNCGYKEEIDIKSDKVSNLIKTYDVKIPRCSNCTITMVIDKSREDEKMNKDVIFFKCSNCGEQNEVSK